MYAPWCGHCKVRALRRTLGGGHQTCAAPPCILHCPEDFGTSLPPLQALAPTHDKLPAHMRSQAARHVTLLTGLSLPPSLPTRFALQALAPTYEKLAKRFAKIDSVVIAKMDGTENEHPDIEAQVSAAAATPCRAVPLSGVPWRHPLSLQGSPTPIVLPPRRAQALSS